MDRLTLPVQKRQQCPPEGNGDVMKISPRKTGIAGLSLSRISGATPLAVGFRARSAMFCAAALTASPAPKLAGPEGGNDAFPQFVDKGLTVRRKPAVCEASWKILIHRSFPMERHGDSPRVCQPSETDRSC